MELLLGQMHQAPHTLVWGNRRKQTIKAGGIDLNTTISVFTQEDAAAVIISDDDETSFPAGWPEAISTPKIELPWGQK